MKVRDILPVCSPESICTEKLEELWSAWTEGDIPESILNSAVAHIQAVPGEWPALRILVK